MQHIAKINNLFWLLFGEGTLKRAILTLLFVGSILITINHGDTLLKDDFPAIWKIILTYIVPFLVTTWGAATVKFSRDRE
tara:strand:+ start:369 stop:608 length:240 start_codon:yes stop_codon:yes gene_type:complete